MNGGSPREWGMRGCSAEVRARYFEVTSLAHSKGWSVPLMFGKDADGRGQAYRGLATKEPPLDPGLHRALIALGYDDRLRAFSGHLCWQGTEE